MPKAKHKTLTLKVRIDPELLREVDLAAADLGFTRSKLVTRGLERVVQKWKERKLEIPSQPERPAPADPFARQDPDSREPARAQLVR